MKRNENGYGTVVCLDKTGKKRKNPYAVRITIGWDDNGRQKTKYLGYYPSRKEANLALAQFHLQGLDYDINTVTFADIFELWKSKRSDKLTTKNLSQYAACYNHLSTLHSRKFKDIKTIQMQQILDGLDFKYSTKNKIKSLLGQMYDVAIENDLAMKNYATYLDINAKQEEVGAAFTAEEIQTLWSLSGTENIVDDVLMLIYMGTRIAETLAITHDAIHLEERYIDIHGTKTAAANRIVPIHEDIVPLIEKRLKENKRYLFERNDASIPYISFNHMFNRMMKKLGFDHKIHDTRKTTTTNLFIAEVPMEIIKFIVGHAQSGVTAEVYLKVKNNVSLLVENINKMQLK